jgi:hypothetical protein
VRAGFARLGPLDLSFDAWKYHTQLGELVDLARAFPATPIVLDHDGVRSASAPMRASATRSSPNSAQESASSRPALHIKLGELGMWMFGFRRAQRSWPRPGGLISRRASPRETSAMIAQVQCLTASTSTSSRCRRLVRTPRSDGGKESGREGFTTVAQDLFLVCDLAHTPR